MAISDVLCHEITDADVKKIKASSNDAQTGGGARDLRFTVDYAPFLDRFFPQETTTERGTPYRIGKFEHYYSSGKSITELVRYAYQPTDTRPREVRIAQINKLRLFLDIPDISADDGALFMAFVLKTDGIPQAQYLTQKQIEAKESNQIIAAAMREALDKRRGNNAVIFSTALR